MLESVSSQKGLWGFVDKHQLLVLKDHILLLQKKQETHRYEYFVFPLQNWYQSWFLWMELVIETKMLVQTHAIHKVSSHSAVAASSRAVSCF